MKDAAAAKEIAEEEVKSLKKKLKDATIKLEEFGREDKVLSLIYNIQLFLYSLNLN